MTSITPLQRERYDSLNGLRALAAIGIVMMHVQANINLKPDLGFFTSWIIPFFTDFTLLFMLLSAFSMCCGYYERVKNGLITPNAFYKRRYQRIFPFFAFLVAIDFVTEPSWGTFCEAFADLTLCFNFLNADIHVIGVGWFLGTIFVFYLLFPFFVFLMDNKKRAWISTTLVSLMCYIAINYFKVLARSNILYSSPFFIIGGLIYLYRKEIIAIAEKHYKVCLTFSILITLGYFLTRMSNTFFHNIAEVILFSVWTVYAIAKKNVVLGNKVMKFLSGISMEIYLCHMMFYRVVEKMHLENFISNNNILYFIELILVLIGAIFFSYIVKYYCFPFVGKGLSKLRAK